MNTLPTIAHISDTHIGRTLLAGESALCASPEEVFTALLAHLPSRCPHLQGVIISGDLVQETGPDGYTQFFRMLERLPVPYALCMGNHDRVEAYRAARGEPKGPLYYEMEMAGLRLLTLDSSQGGGDPIGALDMVQLEWLQERLAQPSAGGSIIIMHHPPADQGVLHPPPVRNADKLAAIIRAAGSEPLALLSGHTHVPQASVFAGIAHYTAGSTSFGFTVRDGNYCLTGEKSFALLSAQAHHVSWWPHRWPPTDALLIQDPLSPLHGWVV